MPQLYVALVAVLVLIIALPLLLAHALWQACQFVWSELDAVIRRA